MPSRTADEIIQKAEECFALDLITERQLEFVTKMALTSVGYDPILDLPFDSEIEHERELRRRAAWLERRQALRRRLRRLVGL